MRRDCVTKSVGTLVERLVDRAKGNMLRQEERECIARQLRKKAAAMNRPELVPAQVALLDVAGELEGKIGE